MAVYIQQQLRRVGVRMHVQPLDVGSLLARLKTGRFEAAFLPVKQHVSWLQQYFGKDSPIGYQNAAVVNLIEQAMVTADPEAQDRIYRELAEVFGGMSRSHFSFRAWRPPSSTDA